MAKRFLQLGEGHLDMQDYPQHTYSVNLDFEEINLPPVTDILILGKKVPQGKQGILHSFELILPDAFVMQEISDSDFPQIDAVIVNKAVLAKLPMSEIIKILRENVFAFVIRGEAIKVNFNIRLYQHNITGEILNENRRADKPDRGSS